MIRINIESHNDRHQHAIHEGILTYDNIDSIINNAIDTYKDNNLTPYIKIILSDKSYYIGILNKYSEGNHTFHISKIPNNLNVDNDISKYDIVKYPLIDTKVKIGDVFLHISRIGIFHTIENKSSYDNDNITYGYKYNFVRKETIHIWNYDSELNRHIQSHNEEYHKDITNALLVKDKSYVARVRVKLDSGIVYYGEVISMDKDMLVITGDPNHKGINIMIPFLNIQKVIVETWICNSHNNMMDSVAI